MTLAVALKLLALMLVVAAGWAAGRTGWLGGAEVPRTLGRVALYLFIPALLLRTTARVDLEHLPWLTVGALFVPLLVVLIVHLAWQSSRPGVAPAAAGTRALSGSFGNTVQLGIPLASALYGEAGLAIHVTLISLHALLLLTLVTAATELALARADRAAPLHATLRATVRNTVLHPVVLPVVVGLAINLAGWTVPGALDAALALLASGVVPLCLVLIGLSLAASGVSLHWRPALQLTLVKMVLQPALVLAVAHWGFGLDGMPLAVVVMLAALPSGSNAQIFAQRYGVLEAETAATIVLSTLLFAPVAMLWLLVLAALP